MLNLQYSKTIFEILLAFENKAATGPSLLDWKMLGGNAFEFFPASQSGLVSYFCVDSSQRKRGLGRLLIEQGKKHIYRIAQSMYPYINYVPIYAETNDPSKVIYPVHSLARRRKLTSARSLKSKMLSPQIQE